jgi:DNA-binding transcriptional LysR family regulator
VSCHIASLEHALGTTLFDRSIQPVAVTPAGLALLVHAEEVLSGIRLLANAAHEDAVIVDRLEAFVPSRAAR